MIADDANAAVTGVVNMCLDWLRLDPTDAEHWRLFAAALWQAKRFQEAEEASGHAVARDPGNADGHKFLGHCRLHRRDLVAAAESYRQALALDQGCASAAISLAQILAVQGDGAQAIELCRQAIAHKPLSAKAHAVFGKLLAGQGRHAEAADSYGKAVELAPDFILAQSDLAKALVKAGRLDEAVAASDRDLKLRAWADGAMPTDDIRQLQGDLAEAVDRFSARSFAVGGEAAAHLQLGKALALCGHRLLGLAQHSLAQAGSLGGGEMTRQVAAAAKPKPVANAGHTNRDALVTTALYYLAKLLGSDKATAHQLLDVLNLDNFRGAVEDPRPDADPAALFGKTEEVIRHVAAGDAAAALRTLRTVAAMLAQLIERGDATAAIQVCRLALDRAVAQVNWPLPLALQAAATGMLWTEKKQRPDFTIMAKHRLHQATNGAANDMLGWIGASFHPPRWVAIKDSLLGVNDPEKLETVVSHLKGDGYHVFDTRLDPATVERLHGFGQTMRCWPTDATRSRFDLSVRYDPNSTEFEGFYAYEQELLDNPDIQAILADPSFLAIATHYFGCEPVLSFLNMWWSLPSDRPASAEMAQMHHFDMDYLRFFKFWIYLTDVDANGGPHVYVKRSHFRGSKPAALLNKGLYARITDEEIARHYKPEDVVVLTAPRGSIITGDTRCWHRGTRPVTHPRLIFQLEFIDSPVMGREMPGRVLRKTADPRLRQLAAAYPRVFSLYDVE